MTTRGDGNKDLAISSIVAALAAPWLLASSAVLVLLWLAQFGRLDGLAAVMLLPWIATVGFLVGIGYLALVLRSGRWALPGRAWLATVAWSLAVLFGFLGLFVSHFRS